MKFEIKHIDQLTIEDFENHSAWAQYYAADEIEHLVNEGYAKEDVAQQLAAVGWSDEYWFKTYHSKRSTPYMFTRFQTDFELPNQQVIKGYIECTEYSGVQHYGLHVKGAFIGLNVQHPDLTETNELEIKNMLQVDQLYPMRITSSDSQLSQEAYRPLS